MIDLGEHRVWIGGFHDHWARTNQGNVALLLAAMNWHHYDFMCLMDHEEGPAFVERGQRLCPWVRLYAGAELMYGWGHVVSVGRPGYKWKADDANVRGVFEKLNKEIPFAALAHPVFPRTWPEIVESGELDRMLDDGTIRAVQFCATQQERAWLKRRQEQGKRTPLITGWDVHNVNRRPGLPVVFYQETSPDGHLDSCGELRSLVLAKENSFEAIAEAVWDCRLVVEVIATGELIGEEKWVRYLEGQGWKQRMQELNRRRDASWMKMKTGQVVAGSGVEMEFSQPGRVVTAKTLDEVEVRQTDGQGRLKVEEVGALLDRDRTYWPVVKEDADGYRRVWAVEVEHTVQLDILPKWLGADRWGVEVRPGREFDGKYRMKVEGLAGFEASGDGKNLVAELPTMEWEKRKGIWFVELESESKGGLKRKQRQMVNFTEVGRFGGDWGKVRVWPVDQKHNTGEGYGCHRVWPGPQEFSYGLQFGWDEKYFWVRCKVVDKVHHNPFAKDMIYQGDCLQVMIDPTLSRVDNMNYSYCYSIAKTKEREVATWVSIAPKAGVNPALMTPRPEAVYADDLRVMIEEWEKGLIYEVGIAWENDLAPAKPGVGHRMGLHVIVMNNNGNGLVDSVRWPSPTYGMWHSTLRRWGVVTLV